MPRQRIINRRRFVISIALALALLACAATVALVVVTNADRTCRSQNRTLDVIAAALTVQVLSPHRFNTPADVVRRLAVLAAALAKIEEARCR